MSVENTPQRLLRNSKEHANEPALSSPVNGDWETDTWAQFASYVMDISKALMIINIYNTDPSLSILLVLIHLFIILFTNCIYIAYSHHQIYILIHFVSLLILLFTSLCMASTRT